MSLLKVDTITNRAGSGSPNFSNGLKLSGVELLQSGVFPYSMMPPGVVIQSKSVTKTNRFDTTLISTYEDVTDLSIAITPLFQNSKFKILFSTGVGNSSSTPSSLRLLRNSTPIFEQVNEADGFFMGNLAGTTSYPIFIGINGSEDSPNLSSEITYKIQAKTDSGTMRVGARADGLTGVITTFSIQEIKQ